MFTEDDQCPYVVGSGIANWSTDFKPFSEFSTLILPSQADAPVFYLLYHGWLGEQETHMLEKYR